MNNHSFDIHKYYVGNRIGNMTFGYTTNSDGLSNYPDHSFNMALYIGDLDENVHYHQEKLAEEIKFPTSSWVMPIQKHGGNIVEVTAEDKGTNIKALTDKFYDVDGLYTYEPEVLLAMNYADCVPVYVYSTTDNFIGLAHAGWRGTAHNITAELIGCYEGNLDDLRVMIGVGINQAYYEVNDVVIDALSPLESSSYYKTDTGFQLDLKKVNEQQAIAAGIKQSNIYVTDLGTEEEDFFSFRLEAGQTGRALAFIGRENI